MCQNVLMGKAQNQLNLLKRALSKSGNMLRSILPCDLIFLVLAESQGTDSCEAMPGETVKCLAFQHQLRFTPAQLSQPVLPREHAANGKLAQVLRASFSETMLN